MENNIKTINDLQMELNNGTKTPQSFIYECLKQNIETAQKALLKAQAELDAWVETQYEQGLLEK